MIDEMSADVDITPMSMVLNGAEINEQNILDAMDDVVDNLYQTADLSAADIAIGSLLGMQKLSGMGLAKLLWGVNKWWSETGQDGVRGDTFCDYMMATHGFKSSVVVDRYVLLWDTYENNLMPTGLRLKPLKDQIAIAQTIEQGYTITPKEWKKLEYAARNGEVLSILREIKGKAPRKNSLQLYEERDGTLVGWDAEGRHVLGWINVQEEHDDPTIHKGLERIRKGASIIER
jgi:hypothetical protein